MPKQALRKRTLSELRGAELAAVLAGLRLIQNNLRQYGAVPGVVVAVYTDMGKYKGLTSEEIDTLCRRLNE